MRDCPVFPNRPAHLKLALLFALMLFVSAAGLDGAAAQQPPNQAPAFDDTTTLLLSVAENTDGDLGDPVTAIDPDAADTLTYSVSGVDSGSFNIDGASASGQLSVSPWTTLDHEGKPSHTFYVLATDPAGAVAVRQVAVEVTDVVEPPDAPDAPTVTAASGTGLTVAWTAPGNTGPAINQYEVQYRAGLDTWSSSSSTNALTSSISGLSPGTTYEVQVRATNPEETGGWSASGLGTTNGIALSVSPERVAEAGGVVTVTVTATRNPPVTTATTVAVSVVSGTATSGADFEAVTDFDVTIAADAASGSATFLLTPITGDTDEGDETITVSGSLTGDTVNDASLTLTDGGSTTSQPFADYDSTATPLSEASLSSITLLILGGHAVVVSLDESNITLKTNIPGLTLESASASCQTDPGCGNGQMGGEIQWGDQVDITFGYDGTDFDTDGRIEVVIDKSVVRTSSSDFTTATTYDLTLKTPIPVAANIGKIVVTPPSVTVIEDGTATYELCPEPDLNIWEVAGVMLQSADTNVATVSPLELTGFSRIEGELQCKNITVAG